MSPNPPVASRYGRAALNNETDIAEQHASRGDHLRVYGAARNVSQLCAGGEIYDSEHAQAKLLGVVLAVCDPRKRRDMRRAIEDGFRDGAEHPRRAPQGGHALTGRADVIDVVDRIRAYVASRSLRQRAHAANEVFCSTAEHIGKVRFDLSYRELAEGMGMSRATAARATDDLIANARILRRVRVGAWWRRDSSRTTWQLIPPKRELVQSCDTKNDVRGQFFLQKTKEQVRAPRRACRKSAPVRRTYIPGIEKNWSTRATHP